MKDPKRNQRSAHLDSRKAPPLPVIGLEAEFTLFINDVKRTPEKVFGTPRKLIRKAMIPRTGRSFQLPAGGALYFPTAGVKVAPPIIELWPGCVFPGPQLLLEQIH